MIQQALSFLKTRFQPDAVYLFGSWTRERQTPQSDVDLAILCPEPVDKERLLDAELELGALINRDVDLVDLGATDTVLQMQVLSHGKLLFSACEDRRLQAEARMMKDYQMLNFSRRIVIIEKYGVNAWTSS